MAPRSQAAPDQWVQISSPHFTVLTNAGDKEGRHLLDQFERMRWVFQKLFPHSNVDPAVPIVVVAAKNEKTFVSMEPSAYLGKGMMKLGGYFAHSPDKNYILLRLDTEYDHPFATVYHEYTHVQFAADAAWMPLWLNEGTAEFFQNTTIEGKNVRIGQASPEDILYLRQTQLVPFNVLFSVNAMSPYYHEEQKGTVFYAESWALVHYLVVTDHTQHTNKLGQYETLLANHEDPVAAGEKAFGDLKQLQKALQDYVRQASYNEFILNSAAAPIDESTFKTSSVSQAQADAVRADVLAHVQRTDEARALLESVLKAEPDNVQAHETMGLLESQAGHPDEGRKWYGEAVKLGSQDFLAYFLFAQYSMGTNDGEAVESALGNAIRLNPRFAPSYALLASYYASKRQNLDRARLLNLQAVQLDPGNVMYRVNTASVLVEMERYDDALTVLKNALQLAPTDSQRAMVESLLQQIEQFRDQQAQARQPAGAAPTGAQVAEKITVTSTAPQRPTLSADGPKLTVEGVMRGVRCNYPTEIEFRVVTGPGKSLSLYNNDFRKIDLTAAAGFKAPDPMNPCSAFEGIKAKVRYVKSSDGSVDGQVTAVELRK